MLALRIIPSRRCIGSLARSLSKFAVHELEFTACQDLYCMQTAAGGRNLPTSGLVINAKYIDTNPRASSRSPTVLMLHGLPGSHNDFSVITDSLASRDVRVIVPNFPGFGWTDMDSEREFKHTSEEKACFILDFLTALQIDRVDLLVAHSGGAFAAVNLCTVAPALTHGLVLINPGVHAKATGYKFLSTSVWVYMNLHAKMTRWRALRSLAVGFLKLSLKIKNYPLQDVESMSTAISSFVQVDFKDYAQEVVALSLRSFPTSIMYSRDDGMVKENSSNSLSQLLGCGESDLVAYNSMGDSVTSSRQSESVYVEGHVFETGGHWIMLKHPKVTSDIIFNLLCKVRQKQGFVDTLGR